MNPETPHVTNRASQPRILLIDRLLPGIGLFRTGQKGLGIFFMLSTVIFFAILGWRLPLVASSIHSLGTGILLIFVSTDSFYAVFTQEMLEFWIASIYLISGLFGLFYFSHRSLGKHLDERQHGPKQELTLSESGWRSFRKHTIALYASVVVFLLYSTAFMAPFLSPFSPFEQQDFLVTAYKPPLTRIDALILKDRKGVTIPLRKGTNLEDKLTNTLITDFKTLKSRNEPNKLIFVDSYRQIGDTVSYVQGPREKTIPLDRLVSSETHRDFVVTRSFILGTDQYGRDILSRVIYGSKISLSIGFLVVLISVTLGTIIGVSSGYFGGIIDNILMRIVDVLIAFPALFLILIIIATFGNSIFLIVITLSFTGWMGVSRIVRGQVLSLKEQEFILAAKSLGLSNLRIIFRHLIPNTLTPVIVAATLRIGSIILTEAGLSFLGLGVQPPTPSWGNIINEGRDSLLNHWWISTFPGIAILSTVVCFNLIGDGVRDALDPRMRV
ncbi:ABC transporter permease [Prosthecochloris sp. ZM]|uniref:ABC transporter permease n=1 Tax=Prosthecochloris sp. ZM TaxID=2283143 RepID=UPI000DF814EC|nr:ABC transporter permease [Prosthecochloris sp. ZM]RDD29978.1 ABC transporter permease [Prosthecochloris sp. ZM]